VRRGNRLRRRATLRERCLRLRRHELSRRLLRWNAVCVAHGGGMRVGRQRVLELSGAGGRHLRARNVRLRYSRRVRRGSTLRGKPMPVRQPVLRRRLLPGRRLFPWNLDDGLWPKCGLPDVPRQPDLPGPGVQRLQRQQLRRRLLLQWGMSNAVREPVRERRGALPKLCAARERLPRRCVRVRHELRLPARPRLSERRLRVQRQQLPERLLRREPNLSSWHQRRRLWQAGRLLRCLQRQHGYLHIRCLHLWKRDSLRGRSVLRERHLRLQRHQLSSGMLLGGTMRARTSTVRERLRNERKRLRHLLRIDRRLRRWRLRLRRWTGVRRRQPVRGEGLRLQRDHMSRRLL
jgi:hypothetical protein